MNGWWAAALVGLGIYGVYRAFYREPNQLVYEHHTVAIPNLPPGLDGLEIVHLSDLYIGGRVGGREHRLTEMVRSSPAPLLVFTGNFLAEDGALGNRIPLLMEMGRGKQAFAVFGDADYRHPGRAHRLRSALEGAGVTVLSNRAVTLSAEFTGRGTGERGGASRSQRQERLWLVGIDDPRTGKGDVDKAFSEVDPGAPTIALVHGIDVAPRAAERGASLVLCGPPRAVQVNLPGFGPLWSRVTGRLDQGLRAVNGAWVYANRGVGTASLPIRFRSLPEVAILTLRREEAAAPAAEGPVQRLSGTR